MKTKYLILGAGISGLSFASYLDKKDDYIILEKEQNAGGLCRTHKVLDFVWDYAGHFFHFKNEDSKKFFAPVLDEKKCVSQIKNTKIFYCNNYIDYPFQKNIHQLEKQDFIDCLYHLFFKQEKSEYCSFKDMLFGKFGKGICERFLLPYNEKLYACDLNSLDKDAMGRFFPYANLKDIISNMKVSNNVSYNDYFIYPNDGAQSVIEYLLKNVDESKIELSTEVKRIDCDKKIVYTMAGDVYEYEYLISSLPYNVFLKLCNRDNDKLSWNKVLVFNIGFDRSSIDSSVHWIYYPENHFNFYRVGFYNNILKHDKLSIYVEIGFDKFAKIDIAEQFNLTLKNLKKCGVITDHKVIAHESLIIDPAYVHISKESKEIYQNNEKYFSKVGIFNIGRYGAWTYCSMEDCFMQSKCLAEKLSGV